MGNDRRHGNWIGGQECPSQEGLFEVFARDGSMARLGEWPLSGAREVGQVLQQLRAGEPCSVTELVLGEGAFDRDLAARLGLSLGDFAELSRSRHGSGFGLGIEANALGNVRVHVFVAGRSMLPAEIAWRVAGLRMSGGAVLVLGSRQLPMASSVAVGALEAAGLGGEGLALLHGISAGGWRALGEAADGIAALGSLDLDLRRELAGSAEQVPGLARMLGDLGQPRETRFVIGDGEADLEAAARRVCAGAFGLGLGLGGWGHGAGLVGEIGARRYSAFVEYLVPLVEEAAGGLAVLGSTGAALRQRLALGAMLEEGATLVVGGGTLATPAGPVLVPGLLVNVDPAGRAAQLGEPLALLRLARRR